MTRTDPSTILKRPLLEEWSVSPLLPWRRYPFPVDWPVQFGRAAPLHLEIGFGDGRYTVRRARDEPEADFVGLEISSASLQRALRKVKGAGLANVKLLKVGAGFAVQHLFAPHSLHSITVNFPDPWPKERHEENRLLREPFFRLAASRLIPGGAILLATDHPDYLQFAVAEAQKSGLYSLPDAEPPAAVFETKYALKWLGQGKRLFYQPFVHNGDPSPDFPILKRETLMPHALLAGELPETIPFDKQVIPYAEGYVIVHEVARSLGSEGDTEPGTRERWLLRVTTDEPDLKQQLIVVVQRRVGNELIVRLESFGDPIITPTVRGAVHAVTEWLLTLPADLRVLERAY